MLKALSSILRISRPPSAQIRTMKILSVAEKNDAAKSIAGHLARGTAKRREGLSPYNKIYEFEINLFNKKCTMIMTSVSGHLLSYEFVGNYKIWQSCSPLQLFDAPVMKGCPEDYQKIKRTLEREVKNCQSLIIWTDCDREGENIGFEIIQVCSAIKPNLQIYRAKFSEITGPSVNRALQNLGQPNKNISDAVDVRQELDLRIGAAFTRFQTLRLQKVFPEQLANSLVSYGSCQFPTLGFVVERYRAVESFVSENFWKIVVTHTLNDLTVEFSWERNRLFDEQACLAIHDVCTENPQATVQNVKSKPKSKWRPLPLDTTEMEKLGSRKLRISAKEIMKIAEKLYTQGIISYPRTETNIYPKELNLSNLVNLQMDNSEWGSFAKRIMDEGGPSPRQGKKSDQAHPPIHPTKHVTNLSGNDKRVYELIVRSFLACCHKDAQGHETIVDIDIAGEKFSASGLMIIARNYLDVYPYEKWSGKEIHIYEQGQTFDPTSVSVVPGKTSPPSLLTEADLISLMEKHGIGTDATHADHIETIKSRSYVALADNIHFVPGLLGMGLVEGYDSMGLSFSKPHLRAGLESDLKNICEGRKQPQDVLAQQIATYKEVYLTVTQEAEKIDQALSGRFNQQPLAHEPENTNINPPVNKCDKCRSDMVLRNKKDNQGFFISCMGFPQCKNAIWLPSFVENVTVTNEKCEICGPSYSKLKFTWSNRSMNHRYPSPFIGCIGGCDPQFLQMLNVNKSFQRTITQNSSYNTSNNTSTSNSSSVTTNSFYQQRSPPTNSFTSNRPIPTNNSSVNQSTNQTSSFFNNNPSNRGLFNGTNNSSMSQNSVDRNTNRNQPSRTFPNANTSNDENKVMCSCGDSAILLTVKKSTANMGRQFYKCSKPKENGGCNFFLWASSDETGDDNSGNRSNTWNNSSQRTTGSSWNNVDRNNTNNGSNWDNSTIQNSSDSNIPMCNCNAPCKIITVHKEGVNKGREFYGCPNPVTNRCNFFQWVDSSSNPSTSWNSSAPSTSRNTGSNRGRQTNRPRNTGERAKKRCGNCREEGHTRNKCPRLE